MLVKSVLVASILSAAMLPQDAGASEELLVFVGRLVEITEVPDPCPVSEEANEARAEEEGGGKESEDEAQAIENIECIRLDLVFSATYEVLDVLVGSAEHARVSMSVADHYGFPSFAEFKHALLFVGHSEDGAWLHKYQGYPVHRTVTGDWASCGNPYDDRVGDDPRHVTPVTFANPMRTVGESSIEGALRRFDERYVEIEGDQIVCRRGVYVKDLYTMVRDGVLSARGVHAPELMRGEL